MPGAGSSKIRMALFNLETAVSHFPFPASRFSLLASNAGEPLMPAELFFFCCHCPPGGSATCPTGGYRFKRGRALDLSASDFLQVSRFFSGNPW